MSLRNEQCNKVCRILNDVLANRPTERDALIVAIKAAFSGLERKTGRWKFYGRETWVRDDGKPVFIQCSECNATVMNNGSAVWNFCPNCGADMRGEDDDIPMEYFESGGI